jgi:hypothetical protein
VGPVTFRRLEIVSFCHSTIYIALLVCAFVAGQPQPEAAWARSPAASASWWRIGAGAAPGAPWRNRTRGTIADVCDVEHPMR